MADVIDYKIFDSTMDLVGITLDPGEAVVIQTGAMVMMDDNISMEAIFGDGSKKERSIFGKVFGSGKRLINKEGLFMTMLENTGTERGNVLLSPGDVGSKIIPIDVEKLSSPLLINKGHFLAVARGMSIGLGTRLKPFANIFGSIELTMHKIEGNGFSFIKSSGPAFMRMLGEGETIKVDRAALVGMEASVEYNLALVKGVKSMFFSGEGMFLYHLTGPGLVILQGGTGNAEYQEKQEIPKETKEK